MKKEIEQRKYIFIREKIIWFSLSFVIKLLNKLKYKYEVILKTNENSFYLRENGITLKNSEFNPHLLHGFYPKEIIYGNLLVNKLKKILDKHKINLNYIVDIGSNIGLMTFPLSKNFPTAKIISIEGSKLNYEILKSNSLIQNFDITNIHFVNELVGENAKKVNFIEGLGEKSQILDENILNYKYLKKNKHNTLISKEMISLEKILEKYKFPNIDYCKIDIEGSEIYLIKSLLLIKPKIITIEYNFQKITSINFIINIKKIIELGYVIYSDELDIIDDLENHILNNKKTDLWLIEKNE